MARKWQNPESNSRSRDSSRCARARRRAQRPAPSAPRSPRGSAPGRHRGASGTTASGARMLAATVAPSPDTLAPVSRMWPTATPCASARRLTVGRAFGSASRAATSSASAGVAKAAVSTASTAVRSYCRADRIRMASSSIAAVCAGPSRPAAVQSANCAPAVPASRRSPMPRSGGPRVANVHQWARGQGAGSAPGERLLAVRPQDRWVAKNPDAMPADRAGRGRFLEITQTLIPLPQTHRSADDLSNGLSSPDRAGRNNRGAEERSRGRAPDSRGHRRPWAPWTCWS